MLAQLKGASRRYVAPVWAMMLVFVLAPALGAAHGAPPGVFSHFLVHAHAPGDHGHAPGGHGHHHHGDEHHHGHHHHHDDGHHHHDDAMDDGQSDSGQGPLHAHYDASCPSALMPLPTASVLYRVAHRVGLPPVDAKQGAPPGRLLRPPILSL
jgi:hypothetical protein